MSAVTITPQELAERVNCGQPVELIDVRTPAEYRELHADIARNVPLASLDPNSFISSTNGTTDKPLYVICKSGGRARQACKKFAASGFDNAVCVEGGTDAWHSAGLSVIRGKKTIGLERQVRIAAGALVLVGSVLGYFVHPYFIGLPMFVGAGLLLAGITDTCGMALLLSKMPWNQSEE